MVIFRSKVEASCSRSLKRLASCNEGKRGQRHLSISPTAFVEIIYTSTMKLAIFASLLASAAAFAPAPVSRTSTSLNEFCKGYVGGEGPEPMFVGETGSKNFDPLGLTEVRRLQLTGALGPREFFERKASGDGTALGSSHLCGSFVVAFRVSHSPP